MTNISNNFQDYDENDSNINFRKNRWNYWAALKKARKEYLQDIGELDGQFDAFDFDNWLSNNYGLKINVMDSTGNITDSYVVIDEQKYILFLLKYQ